MCSDLIYGLLLILRHYTNDVGSLHEIITILTTRIIPVTIEFLEESFFVAQLVPKGVSRFLAHYSYNDVAPSMEGEMFLTHVIKSIKYHIINEEHKEGANDHLKNLIATDNVEYEELQQINLVNNVEVVNVLGKTILRLPIQRYFFQEYLFMNIIFFMTTMNPLFLPGRYH